MKCKEPCNTVAGHRAKLNAIVGVGAVLVTSTIGFIGWNTSLLLDFSKSIAETRTDVRHIKDDVAEMKAEIKPTYIVRAEDYEK